MQLWLQGSLIHFLKHILQGTQHKHDSLPQPGCHSFLFNLEVEVASGC